MVAIASNRTISTLAAVLACERALLRASDELELAAEVCQILVDKGGLAMVWIGSAEHDRARTVRPVAWAGAGAAELLEAPVSWAEGPAGRGPVGVAIRSGTPSVAADVREDAALEPWRLLFLARGYGSAAAFPMVVNGACIGSLNVFTAAPESFDDATAALLALLATDIGHRISWCRAAAAHRYDEARHHLELAAQVRLQQTLDRLSVFVGLVRPDGTIGAVNQAVVDLSGLRREQLIGVHCADTPFFPPDSPSRAMLIEALVTAATGIAVRRELWMRGGAGELTGVEARFEPIVAADGRVVEIVASATDLTALRRTEQSARAMIANSHDLIAVIGADGIVQMVSPSVERVGGYRPEQVVGRPILDLVHPSERARAGEQLRDILATADAAAQLRLPLLHSDGSHRTLDASVRNLLHVEAIRGILVNARDVSEQLAAEERLRQVERLEAIGLLSGGVAHDFNNLLTVMIANTEYLENNCTDSEAHSMLEEVRVAAMRAAELTSKLLMFARKGLPRREAFDTNRIVAEVMTIMARTIDRRVVVEDERCPDPMLVEGDTSAVQSAILNLAVNARDSMTAGGRLVFGTRGVEVSAEDCGAWPDPVLSGPHVAITVTDTGTGIPREIANRVFEPFFTTKAVDKGTGLGLAAVRACARSHGGSVMFETGPTGTCFTMILPVALTAPRTTGAPEEHIKGFGRIMVVDDEEPIRTTLQRALGRLGFSVHAIGDPAVASSILQAHGGAYRAVVLDINMPGISGLDVLEAVRAARPTLPVLLCSGHAPDGIPREVSADRYTTFLAKPFTLRDLSIAIGRACGQQGGSAISRSGAALR